MIQLNYVKCKCITKDKKFIRGNMYPYTVIDPYRVKVYEPNTKTWNVFQIAGTGYLRTKDPIFNCYFDSFIYRKEVMKNKKQLNSFINNI